MVTPVSIRTVRLLRDFAVGAPLDLRVRGDCMAPWLANGATLRVSSRRLYWPGDLVVVLARRTVAGAHTVCLVTT